ncbi:MAG: asparagine synthase (glutamine-hydrolyzing) [Dehalococcoidia bacterium]|nr:asparagine synthase (glutamine-hydrolyzing) [Dehalococcoidia bacterium]
MCGITGFLNFNGLPVDVAVLSEMTACLTHRGPDDEGYLLLNMSNGRNAVYGGSDTPDDVYSANYSFTPHQRLNNASTEHNNYDLAFGHRRLSIIDLSPSGHQPMCSRDGKYWIIYNGEIFNYIELREDLKQRGHEFVTESDTEVILEAYDEWGCECLSRFNGMWAFTLWDRDRRRLFCARDRFGIKPFYYYAGRKVFVFASEIQALLPHPAVTRQVNDEKVYDYLMWGFHGYSADTFFKDIKQLDPGHYLTADISGDITVKRWWRLSINADIGHVSDTGVHENAEKLAMLLEDSIRLRLRSDVPVGTCLSGGLDSSSIVCLANRLMFNDVSVKPGIVGDRQKTFSSCHDDARIDERKFIEEVIGKTKAEKNYVFPGSDDLWEDLSELIAHQGEPFGTTSIYAQWCVMKEVRRRGVKVLLDGQGGDELLAGYHPYYGTFLINLLSTGKIAQALSEGCKIASIVGWPSMMSSTAMSAAVSIFNVLPVPLQSAGRRFNSTVRGKRMNRIMTQDFDHKHFAGSITHFKHIKGDYNNLQKRLAMDVVTELSVLLRFEDRNSMAFSVESRVPFLDYRLVEFVFSLPSSYKIHNGWTKWILREAMEGILPENIRWRRDKLGFPTPESAWMRQKGDRVREIFSDRDFKASAYIDNKRIAQDFNSLLNTQSLDGQSALWKPLNLEMWMREMFP